MNLNSFIWQFYFGKKSVLHSIDGWIVELLQNAFKTQEGLSQRVDFISSLYYNLIPSV